MTLEISKSIKAYYDSNVKDNDSLDIDYRLGYLQCCIDVLDTENTIELEKLAKEIANNGPT